MFFDTGLSKRKFSKINSYTYGFENQLRPNLYLLNFIEHLISNRTQHTDMNLIILSTKQSAYITLQ